MKVQTKPSRMLLNKRSQLLYILGQGVMPKILHFIYRWAIFSGSKELRQSRRRGAGIISNGFCTKERAGLKN